jgi:NAD(P)-dependent dehydrogenase (short-subunit alcohol dehydrogenase family)
MVGRHMLDRGEGGRIINIASIAGKRGGARFAAYCASKFAVIGFTQAMAMEVAFHGITVNSICPGTILTERSADIAVALAPDGTPPDEASEAFARRLAAAIPVGRMGHAADVATVVAFLVSEEADFLTGMSIPVTGGEVMW